MIDQNWGHFFIVYKMKHCWNIFLKYFISKSFRFKVNVDNVHVLILSLHFDTQSISKMRVKTVCKDDILCWTYLFLFIVVKNCRLVCRWHWCNVRVQNQSVFLFYVLKHDLQQFSLRHMIWVLSENLLCLLDFLLKRRLKVILKSKLKSK